MGEKTCGRCGGSGTVYVSRPSDPPHVQTCPNCGGCGSEYQWSPPPEATTETDGLRPVGAPVIEE